MTGLLLLAVLAQSPDAGRPGEFDAPVLIDIDGRITTLDGGALPLGASCLTYDKAASVRDDLVAKNARVATLEAGSGIDWPLVLGLSSAAAVVMAVVAGGVGYAIGSHR